MKRNHCIYLNDREAVARGYPGRGCYERKKQQVRTNWDRKQIKDLELFELDEDSDFDIFRAFGSVVKQFSKSDSIVDKIGEGTFGKIFKTENGFILKMAKKNVSPEEFNYEYKLQQILAKKGLAPKVKYGFLFQNNYGQIPVKFFAMEEGKNSMTNVISYNEITLYNHFAKVLDKINLMLQNGIVCVDLKPGNAVMINNEILLIDFGKDYCVTLEKPLKQIGFVLFSNILFLTYVMYTLLYTPKGQTFDKKKVLKQIKATVLAKDFDEKIKFLYELIEKCKHFDYYKLMHRQSGQIEQVCKNVLETLVHEEDLKHAFYILEGFETIFKAYARIDTEDKNFVTNVLSIFNWIIHHSMFF